MKRFLKRALILSFVLIISLAFTGCSIFADGVNREPISDSNNQIIDDWGDNATFDSGNYSNKADLLSSVSLSSNIVINYKDRGVGAKPMSVTDAYNQVKGSTVAIYISTAKGASAGSGTIIDVRDIRETATDVYYILTCYHVIEGKGNVQIFTIDDNGYNYGDYQYNEKYSFTGTIGGTIKNDNEVSLVGGDMESDVAILKVKIAEEKKSPLLYKAPIISEEYDISVSEQVFLLGNPTGVLGGTFTEGYVAGELREQMIDSVGKMVVRQLNVDAWHGNSGGGLYNLYGELIGVLNSGSDQNSGINFAIPTSVPKLSTDSPFKIDNGFVNILKNLMGSATSRNYGYVSGRKYKFGFTVTTLSNATTGSPVIAQVTANGLAEKGGMKANDVVKKLKINSDELMTINSYASFIESLDKSKIGDKLEIYVDRSGVERKVSLTNYQFFFCNTGLYN